jgi:hypothetical protein
LLILAACGLLARRPKIDQFSHSAPRYRPGRPKISAL